MRTFRDLVNAWIAEQKKLSDKRFDILSQVSPQSSTFHLRRVVCGVLLAFISSCQASRSSFDTAIHQQVNQQPLSPVARFARLCMEMNPDHVLEQIATPGGFGCK
ncbi:hypothetical protein MRB53_040648 [Persea americana]|nr:hypothetical protein MRB53_040648 [Persea americana]